MSEGSVGSNRSPLGAGHFPGFRNSNQQRSNILSNFERRLEFLQILAGKCVSHVHHGWQAHVRLVTAIQADGLVVTHARKRRLDLASGGLERGSQKSFHNFPDAFGLWIGHLQIDLGKFRLPVSAQVFVPEAAHDLKIFIKARNHQNLFEQLW